MADERVLSVAPSIVDPTPRTKPRPTRTGLGLEHVYVQSDDGIEENLVIILHGLGDTMTPFVRMARQLKLPQTSALVLQASESLPFLDEGEEMYQWYPSFTSLGELIERPNPLPGVRALHRVIGHLEECGWSKERIHLFGFAQGGTVGLESALRLEGGVKSAVSVGGGLIELPTRPGPGAGTRVLYVGPKTGTTGLSKGFGNVRIEETKEVRMVQGPEWSVVMRFWSEVVERRGPEGEGTRTLGRARHRKCVSLSSANLTPHGSRVRSSAAPPASPPVRLNRRSLGVIEERASPPKLSTYAKLFSRFRRAASTDSNLPADPKPEQPGPSVKPRRTLRKRTSQQIPPTPRRDTASTSHSREQTTSNREQTTSNREPKPRPSRDVPRETVPIPTTREAVTKDTVPPKEPVRRVSPVRRPTSPVPFNPPAPIPLPTPVTPPRQRQRTGTLPSDMHRPGSPNKQSLKTWWKQFKLAQPVSLKKDHDDLKNTPHTVFGIPLRESLRYASVQISTANPQGELYVWGYIPVVVAKCGLFLKENATEVEGVFRINGSSRRMRDLQAIFESPPRYGKDLNWKHESYTSHDVASVFRRYLTQMPEPVIPTEQYHNFRAALAKQPRDESEVIHIYRKLIKDMPRANQYLLLYVLDLLSVFARKSEKNLMTETMIFRPGIISHPTHEMQPQEHALSQEVLVFLIQHQDHFMLDPPARGDSIMLSSGNTPGLSPNRADFSPPATERAGYIVPSDSDEDPPPGGYKLVERRRDPSGLVRRRSLNDPGVTTTLTTEPESIGSDSPVSGSIEGGKVKRSRTAPSQRGATLDKRRVKRLDTLGSVGSAQEAGIIEKERVVKDEPDRDAPTPTSTTAVVNS